jgi:tRNA-specific 2-thiouridylase
LYKGKDQTKDQSYFLFATLKNQLDYVRFPIGNFLKSEIRESHSYIKIIC